MQSSMSEEEKDSISCCIIRVENSYEDEEAVLSFAQRAMKRQKVSSFQRTKYIDIRFLLPTSNLCERLFSKAGYAFNERRRGILPSNFESQIFLNLNRDLWSAEDIPRLSQALEEE